MESGGASWRGDGWLEAGCLPQRRAEIHNLWRKILRLLCLSKSCKSLHFWCLLALGSLSLSLSSRSHMEISSEEREKKILKVRDVPLTYFRNFVHSHWRGRDHIAFTFHLRSAPTSKMHYLLHFCWFLSCSLQFILKGHVCKRSLLLSLIPISLNADALGLQDPVRHTLDEQKSTSLTNGAF